MRRVSDRIVVEGLTELADTEFQTRAWLGHGPEVSTFTECVAHLFDDSGLGIELYHGRTVYDTEIDDRLRRLSALLKRVDDDAHPAAVLRDPTLEQARAMAREILADIAAFLESDPPLS